MVKIVAMALSAREWQVSVHKYLHLQVVTIIHNLITIDFFVVFKHIRQEQVHA
jgi:hypothetical protein